MKRSLLTAFPLIKKLELMSAENVVNPVYLNLLSIAS